MRSTKGNQGFMRSGVTQFLGKLTFTSTIFRILQANMPGICGPVCLANRVSRTSIQVFILYLFIPAILFLFHQQLFAETEVEGDVFGTWNTEGSPYILTSDVTVPSNNTLYIEPGVTIEFPDQNQDQFFFNIHGTLEAVGTEQDSILFLSEGAPFLGFYAEDDFEDMRIHLEYCVVDSTEQIVGAQWPSSVVLRHSRFQFSGLGMQTWESADTIQNCEFNYTGQLGDGDIVSWFGGPSVFTANKGNIRWAALMAEIAPVHGNCVNQIDISDVPGIVEIYNNEFSERLDADNGEYDIHDNMGDFYDFSCSSGIVENNRIGKTRLFDCGYVEIRNNEIISDNVAYAIQIFDSDCLISNNLIVGPGCAINNMFNDEEETTIINNTLVFGEKGVWSSDIPSEIINNIFVGTPGYESLGIWIQPGDIVEPTTHYNLFYDVPEIVRDNIDELNETNFVANPQHCGGYPFDYHLQANSPCIDAGDPDSPDDPDDTPADIGCYFYNQSIDNPPTLNTPQPPIQQTGQPFVYEVTATDDNGPLEITFADLPLWMQEDELDWVGDTALVAGIVPEYQEAFSFRAFVEDGLGQTDSADIFIGIDPRTVLAGTISGTLTAEMSPYYVVTDIVVPEGDSLIIEPGCEMQFRYVEDVNQLLRMTCYGTFVAEGTEEDSIRFTMANDEATEGGWYGIRIIGNTDTSSIKYSRFDYGYVSINIDSNATVRILDSCFPLSDFYTIQINNQSTLFLKNNRFYTNYDLPYIFIRSWNSNMNIDSCLFVNENYESNSSPGIRSESSTTLVTNSTFFRTGSINSEFDSDVRIIRNYLYSTRCSESNNSRIFVANNIIIGLDEPHEGGVSTYSPGDTIINNIFSGLNTASKFNDYTNGDHFPVIRNNIFIENDIAIRNRTNLERDFIVDYNCFWNNDTLTVDCPIDSTNLLIDPQLADTSYHLYDSSPLINAGHPATEYFDEDGSRNDIGLWGGPHGDSYEYPLWVLDAPPEMPSELKLFAPYPNPFNSTQNVHIALPQRSEVVIRIYNVIGQEAFKRQYHAMEAGYHNLTYNADQLSSGMYFLEIHAGSEKKRIRVVHIK